MKAPTLGTNLKRAYAFLARTQAGDGSFAGVASFKSGVFAGGKVRPTTFITALVASVLGPLPKTSASSRAMRRMAAYLEAQLSADWSVNYMPRTYTSATERYPDDLDDTMVTLTALWHMDPARVTESALGHVARLLTRCEVRPGGPYRTWLAGANAPAVWQDVDLAVNGNIGYFLWLQDVTLPALHRQWATALAEGHIESAYYDGPLPVLYFWSRYDVPAQRGGADELVLGELKNATNPLALALAMSIGGRWQLPREELLAAGDRLLKLQAKDGSWPAAAFIKDGLDGKPVYVGSPALTTALCIEALQSLKMPVLPKPEPHGSAQAGSMAQAVNTAARNYAAALPAGPLSHRYQAVLESYLGGDGSPQITLMPEAAMKVLGVAMPQATIVNLALGSLYGWMAYTIYDDFLDNEARPELLGVANVAMREVTRAFAEALPDSAVFNDLVQKVLNETEAANTWEVSETRATFTTPDHLHIPVLPNYGTYTKLAERSMGHSLAAIGVALAAGHKPGSAIIRALEQFFFHFLIARQLNDDAHDWEADLRHGHITAAVSQLLHEWSGRTHTISVDLTLHLPALRAQFWNQTIDVLAAEIIGQVDSAEHVLAQCSGLADPAPFTRLVQPLRVAAQDALREKQQVLEFIAGFEAR